MKSFSQFSNLFLWENEIPETNGKWMLIMRNKKLSANLFFNKRKIQFSISIAGWNFLFIHFEIFSIFRTNWTATPRQQQKHDMGLVMSL
jgi:hypothetical protein